MMNFMHRSESAPTLVHLPKLDPKKIPNLPGNRITPFKTKHSKSQCFGFVNGQRMENREGLSYDRAKFVKAPKQADTWRQGSLPNSSYKDVFAAPKQEWEMAPAWDVFDRHVLRFYGFTKEVMTETNLENHRVRKVKILYYLEDDTAQMMEPKVECSGTQVFASAGGLHDKGLSSCILRRHRIPVYDGSSKEAYLTVHHLRLGEDVEIYGRSFRLTDCDPFTREYYQSIGCPQPTEYSPREPPSDPFETMKAQKTGSVFPPKTVEKYHMETMLGGGHCNRDMQKFLETSDKVCRFYAMVNDLNTAQYERRPFIVLFFLVDDSVEIREQYPLNCGRENFPLFYRRNQMVRSGDLQVRGPMDPAYKKDEFLGICDFAVGKTVRMCNMDFFIYDADGYTRKHFIENLKMPLDAKIDVRVPTPAAPEPPMPPYTGFGSWDDSMGSVLHLVPKVPRKDMHKLFFNQGKVLRFAAKFGGEVAPEDLERRFVFAYYLQDDALMVHEPPQRNLGIVTGKFFEKGVYFNQVTGQLVQPEDMLPGKTIKVLSHEFIMLDMDEYSRNYFQAKAEDTTVAPAPVNLESVLANLRESMRQQYPLMRDVFQKFDCDRNGVLCYYEFDRALQKFAFQLTPEETLCIMRHFDKEGKGQVSYNDFCNVVFDDDYSTKMMAKKSALDCNENTISPYASAAATKTVDRSETDKIRAAAQKLGHLLYSRPTSEFRLRQEFRHQTHEHLVTVDMIRNAFLSLGHTLDNELIDRALQFLMKDNPEDGEPVVRVNYNDFLAQLKATYHDLAAPR